MLNLAGFMEAFVATAADRDLGRLDWPSTLLTSNLVPVRGARPR